MKMRSWNAAMTDKETADLAYWERNVLALVLADGWYNDDIEVRRQSKKDLGEIVLMAPRYEKERRVLSCFGGKATFHIPNDFDIGGLPQIERNWDGHSTEEKWAWLLKEKRIGGFYLLKKEFIDASIEQDHSRKS